MSGYPNPRPTTDPSEFSMPPPRRYHRHNMSLPQRMSLAEKHETILALRQHRINTLIDLRRVEKAFAQLNTPDVSTAMTAAWTHYVSSHGLLIELRALTRTHPFSSHCIDEAKRRVYTDPESNRSWNLCWLVLCKIERDGLIAYYARYEAEMPAASDGRTLDEAQVQELAGRLESAWKGAVRGLLRYWEESPTHYDRQCL